MKQIFMKHSIVTILLFREPTCTYKWVLNRGGLEKSVQWMAGKMGRDLKTVLKGLWSIHDTTLP